MAKLLATDLDGTLMYPTKITRCIPKKNVKFLREWSNEGNNIVLITSRSINFMDRLHEELQIPFDSITCTSSVIEANNKIIRNESMDNESLKNILETINKDYHPLAFLMTTDKENLVIKNLSGVGKFLMFFYKLYWIFQFKRREPYKLDNKLFDEELENSKVYKVMIFFGLRKNKNDVAKRINKILREQFPTIECSWSSVIIELTPPNCNKGEGLEYYINSQGIDRDDVYVIGDSGNDITMFNKFHKHSTCMLHAFPSIRKYAKYTISRVYKLKKVLLKKEK
mgnify:CR=1 FL=1